MANRCASSRTRCSRYSASEVRGRITGSGSPGSQTSSMRLASPHTATSTTPRSSSDLLAAAVLLLLEVAGEPAADDLGHRGGVVGAVLHGEAAVVRLLGQAVLED